MLPDGHYAVQSGSGSYRLIWLKTVTNTLGPKDAEMFGKRILYYKKSPGWQSFAFLKDDGTLQIFKKVTFDWTVVQLETIREAVEDIKRNPEKARKLYKQLSRKETEVPK